MIKVRKLSNLSISMLDRRNSRVFHICEDYHGQYCTNQLHGCPSTRIVGGGGHTHPKHLKTIQKGEFSNHM